MPSLADLQKLAELLGPGAAAGGEGALARACAELAARKNRQYAAAYAAVPYSRRLVLVPQCLRASGRCRAEERGAEYLCRLCRACPVAAVVERAGELGYLGVKILKGGSAVAGCLRELAPGAVLGLACAFEGAVGISECERLGVPVRFVPLARDGCADTDVDLAAVMAAMEELAPG